ncbi:rhodanese-like domain-containing protein [Variovorax sp. YR752]|uniref:rhodanese-like domain-containing protein n=1 Tax=Variovorax sp. YR752 TaxID=1884383 RepID=UPI003137CDBB
MNARVDLPAAREVCPTATRRLLAEGALLVDVRERAEVARMAFDVPALVQMPLSEFERRFDELPRDRPLVLACESGPRSLKATYFLMYQGFTDVSNMDGGLAKWARKGSPVAGTAAPAVAAAAACCGSTAAASGCCDSTPETSTSAGCCETASASGGCCCPASPKNPPGGPCC